MAKIKLWQWAIISILLIWSNCFGLLYFGLKTAMAVSIIVFISMGTLCILFSNLNRWAETMKKDIVEITALWYQTVFRLALAAAGVPALALPFLKLQLGPWYIGLCLSLLAFLYASILMNRCVQDYYGWQASLDKVLKLQEKEKLA